MSKYGYTHFNSDILRLGYSISGTTPLHEASKQGQIYIIKILVKENIEYLNIIDKNGMTPLHYSAVFKQRDAYSFLLEQGANSKCLDNFGRTPESIMIANSDIELAGNDSDCFCIIV